MLSPADVAYLLSGLPAVLPMLGVVNNKQPGVRGPAGPITPKEVEEALKALKYSQLADVNVAGLGNFDFPVWNGADWVPSNLRLVNIEDHGAVSGEDSTAAIKAAFAEAEATGRGLLIPPGGTYKVSEDLELWEGAEIWGYGTLDILANHEEHDRRILGEGLERVTIRELHLECSNSEARTGVFGMLSLYEVGEATVQNLWVDGGESCGFWCGEVERLQIVDARIFNVKADGIHLSRGTSHFEIVDSYGEGLGDDFIGLVSYKKTGEVEHAQMSDGLVIGCMADNFTEPNGKVVSIVGAKNVTVAIGNGTGSNEGGYTVAQEETTYTAEDVRLVGLRAYGMATEPGFNISGTRVSLDGCEARGCELGANLTGSKHARINGGSYTGNKVGVYENGCEEAVVRGADLSGNSEAASNAPNTAFYSCDPMPEWNVIAEAALQNGWKYVAGFPKPAYFRDALGAFVHLRGLIKSGEVAEGKLLFTLPVGYRPKEETFVEAFDSANKAIRLDIHTNGQVTIGTGGGSNAFFNLATVSFSIL